MILGVGLSRTGTKSLNSALEILGYKSAHLPTKEMIISGYYDALTDIPTLAYFDKIIDRYPNATLVLTTRERTAWLDSCCQKFKPTNKYYYLELRELVYGSHLPGLWDFVAARNKYLNFFKGYKKHRLIRLPIEAENKWEILCQGLGKKIPQVDYPHIV